MRKAERAINDIDEIIKVLESCQTIRLGLFDENYPYVVPLSFGFETINGKVNIYFHCAKEGKKIDLMARNGNVCVEADSMNGYVSLGHGTTADYQSVIGFGKAEQVNGEDAIHGLELLLSHCGVTNYSARDCVMTDRVAVYRVVLDEISGKRRFNNEK